MAVEDVFVRKLTLYFPLIQFLQGLDVSYVKQHLVKIKIYIYNPKIPFISDKGYEKQLKYQKL